MVCVISQSVNHNVFYSCVILQSVNDNVFYLIVVYSLFPKFLRTYCINMILRCSMLDRYVAKVNPYKAYAILPF